MKKKLNKQEAERMKDCNNKDDKEVTKNEDENQEDDGNSKSQKGADTLRDDGFIIKPIPREPRDLIKRISSKNPRVDVSKEQLEIIKIKVNPGIGSFLGLKGNSRVKSQAKSNIRGKMR